MLRSTERERTVLALVNDYNVIVLDRDLPGMHGEGVCAELLEAGARAEC